MAQAYTTNDGITLINPGTYVSTKVQSGQGNIATAGVITLIGEADEGIGFQDEPNLDLVAFTPEQYGAVLAKYKSGRLVDAFRAVIAASNDNNIVGAPSLIRLIKTNKSSFATSSIIRSYIDSLYTNLKANRAGASGNLIKYQSFDNVAEIAPTTGQFAYTPQLSGNINFDIRINGESKKSISLSPKTSGPNFISLIEDTHKGILAKGGNLKNVIPVTGISINAVASSSDTLVVTLQPGQLWAQSPQVGDSAVIPANGDYGAAQDSAISGAGLANVGSYVVTAVINTPTLASITLKRISAGSVVAVSGTTNPDLSDLILFSPIEIKNISGDDRGTFVGVDGTYNSTLNDGSNIVIQAPTAKNWSAIPKTGDYLVIPSTFCNINTGFYLVTNATSNTISATRISEGSSGTTTGSTNVVGPIDITNQPIQVLSKVKNGLGKSIAIEGNVSQIFRNKDTTLDANLSNSIKYSASELVNEMVYSQNNQSEKIKSGGEIVLAIGCSQDNAQIKIYADKIEGLISSVVQFTIPFSQFKTLKDVADYISSQPNWSAQVTSSRFQSISPADLDRGTFGASSANNYKPARLKRDAVIWYQNNLGSTLVQPQSRANAGLPEAMSNAIFLSGGAKNGTTTADITQAIDALEKLDTNFIVPLFSQDASLDIVQGETESSSTYTIDAINAYVKAHVLKMSAVKMRKNRQAFCSKRASYIDVKEAAGELASSRIALCFQDVLNVSAEGVIKKYQPFMASIIAAGMLASAGYRGIVKKFANVSGVMTPFNDFDQNNPGDTEDALKAGLLFMEKVPTGGFRWISDQSTYGFDNNFVYNSLTAVYIADLITLTLIDRFDKLVVGKSVAEISRQAALSLLESELFNFYRLRWITASDDGAPRGYKNATAQIRGGVLSISVEIKLAGLIYFVPIQLTISEVQQG
jgi:hypothetical protein